MTTNPDPIVTRAATLFAEIWTLMDSNIPQDAKFELEALCFELGELFDEDDPLFEAVIARAHELQELQAAA
jgi:hypothetical protein